MKLSESKTQSFIVRIWREEDGHSTWRGHITHVPSGEKKYFQELSDITNFIKRYLDPANTGSEKRKGIYGWLRRSKLAKYLRLSANSY